MVAASTNREEIKQLRHEVLERVQKLPPEDVEDLLEDIVGALPRPAHLDDPAYMKAIEEGERSAATESLLDFDDVARETRAKLLSLLEAKREGEDLQDSET